MSDHGPAQVMRTLASLPRQSASGIADAADNAIPMAHRASVDPQPRRALPVARSNAANVAKGVLTAKATGK